MTAAECYKTEIAKVLVKLNINCDWCLTEYDRITDADYLAPQIHKTTTASGNTVKTWQYVPICDGCLGDWYAGDSEVKVMPLIKIQAQ